MQSLPHRREKCIISIFNTESSSVHWQKQPFVEIHHSSRTRFPVQRTGTEAEKNLWLHGLYSRRRICHGIK